MLPDELEAYKQAIAAIESNNGQNVNHPVVNYGLNKGMHAIGTYGLMPITIDELAKKNNNYSHLVSMNPSEKEAYLLAHPEAQDALFSQQINQLAAKPGSTPANIAYRWNKGTSLNPNNINPEMLEKNDYVNKFNKLMDKFKVNNNSEAKIVPENEKKSKIVANNLPTNGEPSFDDLVNSKLNPFNEDDQDEENHQYL
jgi:hypothetical protein